MGSFDVSLHPDCRTLQCGSGCLSLFKFAPPTKANWPGRIRRGCQLPDTPCPGIIARGWFRSLGMWMEWRMEERGGNLSGAGRERHLPSSWSVAPAANIGRYALNAFYCPAAPLWDVMYLGLRRSMLHAYTGCPSSEPAAWV